jgi:hypothetical protein
MVDLTFAVDGAEPVRDAAAPAVGFRLRVIAGVPVHSVALRCQVRIQPARRRYSPAERGKLLDLLGTPDRWDKTVRDLHWATVGVTVPPFAGETAAGLLVPCDRDPVRAAAKYFTALDGGDAAVLFLFSGTVFYEAAGVGPQVGFVPWDRETRFRLPVAVWKDLFAEAVTS